MAGRPDCIGRTGKMTYIGVRWGQVGSDWVRFGPTG